MIKKIKMVSLAVLVSLSLIATPVAAIEFSEVGFPAAKAIELTQKKVVVGYPDGTLGLGDEITRAEFATIAARSIRLFENKHSDLNIEAYFSDVKNGTWYSDPLSLAIQEGIINGYPDGTFKPSNKVTNQEVVTMMVRMVTTAAQRTEIDQKGGYPLNYIKAAEELGLLKDSTIRDYRANATRADSFNIAFNTIEAIEDSKKPEVAEEFEIEAHVVSVKDEVATVKVLKDSKGKFEKELKLTLKDSKVDHVYKIILTEDEVVKEVKDISVIRTGVIKRISKDKFTVEGEFFDLTDDTLVFENGRGTTIHPSFLMNSFEGQIISHEGKIISVNMFKYTQEKLVVFENTTSGAITLPITEIDSGIDATNKHLNIMLISRDGFEKQELRDIREDDILYINPLIDTIEVMIFRNTEYGVLNIGDIKIVEEDILGVAADGTVGETKTGFKSTASLNIRFFNQNGRVRQLNNPVKSFADTIEPASDIPVLEDKEESISRATNKALSHTLESVKLMGITIDGLTEEALAKADPVIRKNAMLILNLNGDIRAIKTNRINY